MNEQKLANYSPKPFVPESSPSQRFASYAALLKANNSCTTRITPSLLKTCIQFVVLAIWRFMSALRTQSVGRGEKPIFMTSVVKVSIGGTNLQILQST